jgi:hypothetical protein
VRHTSAVFWAVLGGWFFVLCIVLCVGGCQVDESTPPPKPKTTTPTPTEQHHQHHTDARTEQDRAGHRLQVLLRRVGDEAILGPVSRERSVQQRQEQEGHPPFQGQECLYVRCVLGEGGNKCL